MSELVLHDVDESILDRLNQTASSHGVSIEEEAKNILNNHLFASKSKENALAKTRAIRRRTAGRTHTSGVQIKREIYEKTS
ncbi:MAG: hypothetical protein AB1656_11945 [Candidatus Omnitrophota bacterium]